LVIATMAAEFRRHFKRPCYPYILALITEMRTTEFSMLEDPIEAIRQRVERVSKNQVRAFQKKLARLSPPAFPLRNPR
jgi:hypothetical protein